MTTGNRHGSAAETGETNPSGLGGLLAPIRTTLIIACGLQAISAAAGVVPFIAVGELGRVLMQDGPTDETAAWSIALIGAAALVVRLVFLMAAGGLTHLADVDFQLALRRRVAAHLGRVPLGWFTERTAGEVKKAVQDDIAALHHMIGHAFLDLTTAAVTVIVSLGYLLWVDWRLTLVSMVPVATGLCLYALRMRSYGEKMAAFNEALGRVNAASVAFVQGIAVVKTFGQARRAYGRFLDETKRFVDYFWAWVSGLVRNAAASEVVLSPLFCLVVVLGVGAVFVAQGWSAPVDLVPFVVLALGFSAPVLTLEYAQYDLMLAGAAAKRLCALMDTPVLPEPEPGIETRAPETGRVVFDNVRFGYDAETVVLDGVNLVLEPGTVTALVGRSGSGKSTLAKLLPRFWDPTGGQITVGGVPVAALPASVLYRLIGFVFQDVQLLRASIRDNIALARPDATMAEIERAAQAAQIHARIVALPRGYDSVVGQDARLSGGEAQRVSIARAILADTPILVLDEATAFADPQSEAAIQDALSTLVAGRTLLVIAHRLYTIVGADRIAVMDRGRIVATGRHDELLDRCELYAGLWSASERSINPIEDGVS